MLKKNFVILIALVLITMIFVPSVMSEEKLNDDLFYKLIKTENDKPEIKIPDYKKIKFDNGLTAYLVKNNKYPVVEITGFIKGGRRQENQEVAGISNIMLNMMSTGTQNLGEEEYAEFKEIHGIDINFNVSNDTFNFRGSALSSEKDKLISILADSLRKPDFSASYFQRILQQQHQYLAQATVQPDPMLNNYFFKNIYQEHPYSFANNISLKKSKIKTFTPDKLRNFYNKSIGPEKMVIAIVGDFSINNTQEILKDNFADWEKQNISIKENEIKEMAYNDQIIIVDKKDADQAHMKIGYNFDGHQFKKETEFLIGNRIFGKGGFSSRLMENVRSEKGYVYSIYSNTSYNKDGGVYYINTKLDPQKAPEVLEAVKDEMTAIKTTEKPITAEEIKESINLYNGLLPSDYKYPIDIINEYIYKTELLNENDDYLNDFIDEYNNLTAQEVQSVMEEYLKPDKLLTVVVGDSGQLKKVFKKAGYKVKIIKN